MNVIESTYKLMRSICYFFFLTAAFSPHHPTHPQGTLFFILYYCIFVSHGNVAGYHPNTFYPFCYFPLLFHLTFLYVCISTVLYSPGSQYMLYFFSLSIPLFISLPFLLLPALKLYCQQGTVIDFSLNIRQELTPQIQNARLRVVCGSPPEKFIPRK